MAKQRGNVVDIVSVPGDAKLMGPSNHKQGIIAGPGFGYVTIPFTGQTPAKFFSSFPFL